MTIGCTQSTSHLGPTTTWINPDPKIEDVQKQYTGLLEASKCDYPILKTSNSTERFKIGGSGCRETSQINNADVLTVIEARTVLAAKVIQESQKVISEFPSSDTSVLLAVQEGATEIRENGLKMKEAYDFPEKRSEVVENIKRLSEVKCKLDFSSPQYFDCAMTDNVPLLLDQLEEISNVWNFYFFDSLLSARFGEAFKKAQEMTEATLRNQLGFVGKAVAKRFLVYEAMFSNASFRGRKECIYDLGCGREMYHFTQVMDLALTEHKLDEIVRNFNRKGFQSHVSWFQRSNSAEENPDRSQWLFVSLGLEDLDYNVPSYKGYVDFLSYHPGDPEIIEFKKTMKALSQHLAPPAYQHPEVRCGTTLKECTRIAKTILSSESAQSLDALKGTTVIHILGAVDYGTRNLPRVQRVRLKNRVGSSGGSSKPTPPKERDRLYFYDSDPDIIVREKLNEYLTYKSKAP